MSVTILTLLQTIGILAGGCAAVYGEYNRRHIVQLRKEVNGQSRVLVDTAHALGVAEGTAAERSDPHVAQPPGPTA